ICVSQVVSYPSPEGEGLSVALSRSVSESEICPDLQASLHAPTNRRGPSLIEKQAEDPSLSREGMNAVRFFSLPIAIYPLGYI
ncbi:MAG TPA: hypothetical protein PK659_10520, partial [Methanothrix sp.]